MATSQGFLGRLKQPEYTGENRCIPCTVVNTLIALGVSGALVVGGIQLFTLEAGLVAGGAFFAFAMLAIYLRGYLVPGTPELTKQYFPPWLLGLFGKEPAVPTPKRTDINPEQELVTAGALEECADRDDLCLTDEFRDAWHREIDRVDSDDVGRDRLLELLDTAEGDVEYDEFGGAFKAHVDGMVVGQWESEAAFLADLGSATALSEFHPEWDGLSIDAKSQLLNGLRLFIDTCPVCGGEPTFGADTVESCCGTYDVAAVACEACQSRLFESRVDV